MTLHLQVKDVLKTSEVHDFIMAKQKQIAFTVPLSEVYFPAVTVCNINQVSICLTFEIEKKIIFDLQKLSEKLWHL